MLDSDPLFADRPDELATLFTVQGDRIVYLRKRDGVTLETIERDQAKRAREIERQAEQGRRFRERQPKTQILLHEVYGQERFGVSLREAARMVLEAGGTIEKGSFGELAVQVPALLTGEAVIERDARRLMVNAAELLVAAQKVVLAEIDKGDGDRAARKTRLDERLPDKQVTIGGGV